MAMTIIFGAPWDSPVCAEARRAPTPVGRTCEVCWLPITASDRGFIRMRPLAERRPGRMPYTPVHRECDLVEVVGGLEGILGRPPGTLGVRETALLAWAWVECYGMPYS